MVGFLKSWRISILAPTSTVTRAPREQWACTPRIVLRNRILLLCIIGGACAGIRLYQDWKSLEHRQKATLMLFYPTN